MLYLYISDMGGDFIKSPSYLAYLGITLLWRTLNPRWHGHNWIACMEACTLLMLTWIEGVIM